MHKIIIKILERNQEQKEMLTNVRLYVIRDLQRFSCHGIVKIFLEIYARDFILYLLTSEFACRSYRL